MNPFENLQDRGISDILCDRQINLPEKISAIEKCFSSYRQERLKTSGLDSKGRSVRYYRLMPLESAAHLLAENQFNAENIPSFTNNQYLQNKADIVKQTQFFIQNAGIKNCSDSDFESLNSFRRMLYLKFPRGLLFKFQNLIGGHYRGLTGIISMSVGAPLSTPKAPNEVIWAPNGIVAAEFGIPPEQVFVCGPDKTEGWIGSENEKEVYTKTISPTWVTNIFLSKDDMVNRLLSDPHCPAHKYYFDLHKQGAPYQTHNALLEFRQNEKLEDLIPESKIQELNPNSDILKKPLGN